MNRHKLVAPTVLLVVWLCTSTIAQTHHHASITVKGSEHPEQISDQRAWLMELIAATAKDSQAARWAWLDKATVTDFRSQFDELTTKYNAGLSDGKHGTTAKDIALRQQFYEDVEQLLKITIGKLQNSMSPSDWESTAKHIKEVKARVTFTDDAPAAATVASAIYHPGQGHLLRTQTYVTEWYAAAGYTTFAEIYTDGTNWYQIVHLYGTSTGQWTCEWNQYQGMWEPPGCPAHHDFYTSNQINGQGWSNYYEGTAWNPAQYMGISHQFQTPVGRNDGSEAVYSDASIICSVAGYLLGASVDKILLNIRFGTTYEAWTSVMGSTGASPTCYVTHACSNQPPFVVDLPYVILLQVPPFSNKTCSPGFTCFGACVRAMAGYPWSCSGTDPRKAFCARLPEGVPNPPQGCTPHP